MSAKFNEKLLASLLVNSYSGDYSKVISVITNYLHNNTDAEVILQKVADKKNNVIAIFGKQEDAEFLINCHMDTVPPTGKWLSDPLKLKQTKDKYIGLGTADTKGSLCAVLNAVTIAKPKALMLLFSVDEEKGASGVKAFLNSKYCKHVQYAYVCEPTTLKFISKHKGYYSFWINVKTKPKHSSVDTKHNAIVYAAKMVDAFNAEGFNVGIISGGVAGNIVPAECKLKITIRTYEKHETIVERIKATLKSLGLSESKIGIQDSFIGVPFNNHGKFPLWKGHAHEVSFWTEAALFEEAGIKSVVFGAGSILQAHSQNEYAYKQELTACQTTFINIIDIINKIYLKKVTSK
jgi:acetylornithine deacetylase